MPRKRSAEGGLQEALQRLGARRVEATLLAALLTAGPLGTKDIVDRTGLRQPEVSVGMQVLRDRGWVEAQAIPRSGKGRPMHLYQLVAAPGEVRKHYEAEGKAAIAALEASMQELRKRMA